jgi:hypothetical protein
MGDSKSQGTRRCRTSATLALAVILALAVLLLPPVAGAAADSGGIGFEARPLPGSPNAELGFFKFDADPGAAVSRTVLVINRTDKAKVIRLAPCDGAAAVFGGVAYTESDKKTQAVGSWVQLSRTSVEVPAGGAVQVPFQVRVPSQVTTGVHVGGIAIWEPAAATTSGSSGGGTKATTRITMVTRMVLTVLVTTPGPAVPNLTISGVKAEARPDGMYVLVAIASDGTAPTSGKGALSLPDQNFRQDIELGDMIPQSSTDYPVKWKADPAKGTYQAQVEISYADGSKTANWSGTITVGSAETEALTDRLVTGKPASGGIPWQTIGWGVLGALGAGDLLLGGILLGRRRRPEPRS